MLLYKNVIMSCPLVLLLVICPIPSFDLQVWSSASISSFLSLPRHISPTKLHIVHKSSRSLLGFFFVCFVLVFFFLLPAPKSFVIINECLQTSAAYIHHTFHLALFKPLSCFDISAPDWINNEPHQGTSREKQILTGLMQFLFSLV